jgi:hypothetical protein
MRRARVLVLLGALALQGCGTYSIDDHYGQKYGSMFDVGTQYSWQMKICENDLVAGHVGDDIGPRWMRCCMWRHGVPIESSTGCEAPPYAG